MSETLEPATLTKSVHVACGTAHAFRVFTTGLAGWWPLDRFAIHDDVREVVWEEREGGEVYEIAGNGDRGHWAWVLAWDPPSRLVIAWQVDPATDGPTEVEVRFAPEGGGTRVELEHRGWERAGLRAAEMRTGYDGGWEIVLARYAADMGRHER